MRSRSLTARRNRSGGLLLLPTAGAATNDALCVLVGLVGALILAAVVLTVVVLQGGGQRRHRETASTPLPPGIATCGAGSSSRGRRLPTRPSRTDITAGIRKVSGRVHSCGDEHAFKGTATVKLTIEPTGEVGRVAVHKGSDAFRSCVASAVQMARFARSRKGLRVGYPFVFR